MISFNNKFGFFIIILSFFMLICLGAQNLEDAYQLELEGDRSSALSVYTKWLDANRNDPLFLEILMHSASLVAEVESAIDFLVFYEKVSKSEKEKRIIMFRIAQILELSGRTEEAFSFYQKAVSDLKKIDPEILLRYLMLQFLSGNVVDQQEMESYLSRGIIPRDRLVDFYVIWGRFLFYKGYREKGISLLVSKKDDPLFINSSMYYFCLWEIYNLSGMRSESSVIIDILKKRFPDSVETMIIEGSIVQIKSPAELFEP